MLSAADEVAVEIEGTVLATPAGLFIDDGTDRYLLASGEFRMGDEIRIAGRLAGNRLTPETVTPASPTPKPFAAVSPPSLLCGLSADPVHFHTAMDLVITSRVDFIL